MDSFPGPSKMHLNDTEFEQWPQAIFDDVHSSDSDDDTLESEHDTESEESASENDILINDEKDFYLGKNNFKWSKDEFPVQSRPHNIDILPGLKSEAKHLGSNPNPEKVWNLMFSDEIINEIIFHTNRKITEIQQNYKNSSHSTIRLLDEVEMRAFLGLLIYTALFSSENENLDSFFATDGTGRDIFRCTMSKRRFEFLITYLRFDNSETRNERKKFDPAAAISTIFERLIENFQRYYSLGPNVTVDEMFIPFRGKSKFRMYLPNKPTKYGIKVQCLTDATNNYLYNAYIHTGGSDDHTLPEEEKKFSIPAQTVIRLCKVIEKSHRNVTADNWYSSISLVEELQKRGLTYVGTLKKDVAEIPSEFLPHRLRKIGSSLHGFYEDITLVSHVRKKGKALIIISSKNHTNSTDTKSEIIEYYNSTKGSVDDLVKNFISLSFSKKSCRWPMTVFYQMVNVSTNNAYILHQSYEKAPKLERSEFLKQLARSLVVPVMDNRLHCRTISKELKCTLERVLNKSTKYYEVTEEEERLENRRRCFLCPPKIKRKTQYLCITCKQPICLQCSRKVCLECCKNKIL